MQYVYDTYIHIYIYIYTYIYIYINIHTYVYRHLNKDTVMMMVYFQRMTTIESAHHPVVVSLFW